MVRWNLYRFDYARFVQIRPYVRAAAEPAAFAAISEGDDTDAITEALIEGDIDAVTARQAFVIALCCLGDPVPCPATVPALLRHLRQDVRSEAGIEMLTDAFAGGRNLESWLAPSGQLAGFLTPEETRSASDAYRLGKTRYRGSPKLGVSITRRGGIIPGVSAFLRHLFDRGLGTDELDRLLREFLVNTAELGQGVAVISV